MVTALRPGGRILLEEPDMGSPFGRTAPDEPAVDKFCQGLRVMIENHGGDCDFGRGYPE